MDVHWIIEFFHWILDLCLEIASSIRIVLGELSERLAQALKYEAELSKALGTLMNYKKG